MSNDKWKKLTGWSLIVVTAGLVIWDIVVASTEEKGDTISEVLLAQTKTRPIIATAIGIIIGHLFWPQGLNK